MSGKSVKNITYQKAVMQRFKQHKPAMVAVWVLLVLLLIALLAPYLANHRPLYAQYEGSTFFPAFHPNKTYTFQVNGKTIRLQNDITDWKQIKLNRVIWPIIPYSPGKNDYTNTGFKSPGDDQFWISPEGGKAEVPTRFRHFLGTNNTGEDVAAGLIHGARISLSIGIISMSIAALLGILFGALAGYFGDRKISINFPGLIALLFGLILGWFYGFSVRGFVLQQAWENSSLNGLIQTLLSLMIFVGIVLIFYFVLSRIKWLPGFHKNMFLPIDSMISRLIEILQSLPVFILILTIAAVSKPSLTNVMVLIGLTSWSGIARLTRAEFLKVRSLEYVTAAEALGFSQFRIILRHALPNCLAPALVSIAFGVAAAILVESSLSFLGVGVPANTVTWGSMINEGRQQFSAWWLVVFPGIFIFITVTAYNLIGDALRDALDPKLQKD